MDVVPPELPPPRPAFPNVIHQPESWDLAFRRPTPFRPPKPTHSRWNCDCPFRPSHQTSTQAPAPRDLLVQVFPLIRSILRMNPNKTSPGTHPSFGSDDLQLAPQPAAPSPVMRSIVSPVSRGSNRRARTSFAGQVSSSWPPDGTPIFMKPRPPNPSRFPLPANLSRVCAGRFARRKTAGANF